MTDNAPRDANHVPTLLVDDIDNPGEAIPVTGEASGSAVVLHSIPINNLVRREYDAITATYPDSTTEVYKYRTGGSSGTVVSTVTVTYSDSTKEELSSVVKS